MERIRGHLYVNLHDFVEVAPGKYAVKRGDDVYKIEGGKALGGSRREWFIEGPHLSIPCTSVREALRLLDGDV